MFSGLVQHIGTIVSNHRNRISVRVVLPKTKLGDSVALNGICLTVTRLARSGKENELAFDVSKETQRKTTIDNWKPGLHVNVERALRATDALGGHIVQGHVDGVGRLAKIVDVSGSKEYWFQCPRAISRYIVPKGSVTVDGVSLTAVKVSNKAFSVALIPYTLTHTNLGKLKKGDSVNLEADIMGKYVSKYLRQK